MYENPRKPGSFGEERTGVERERGGRFSTLPKCDFCGKPISGEHFSDTRVCGGGDGPGFFLCDRVRCTAARDKLEAQQGLEALGEHYAQQRAKNEDLTPNGRVKLRVTSAQMSIVQIHCDDPAHDEDRQPWWPTQISPTHIAFPEEHVADVADLLTEIANSESDDPGGDRGAWRAATALASKVRGYTPNGIREIKLCDYCIPDWDKATDAERRRMLQHQIPASACQACGDVPGHVRELEAADPAHGASSPKVAMLSPIERRLYDYFASRAHTSTTKADALRMVPDATRTTIDRLIKKGLLVGAPGGGYRVPTGHTPNAKPFRLEPYHRLDSRHVLGGAYRGRDIDDRNLLTHSVVVDTRDGEYGSDVRTLCRQPVDRMADVCSASPAEAALPPTCPRCLERWERLQAHTPNATRLILHEPHPEERATAALRSSSLRSIRNKGDLQTASLSAAFLAKSRGESHYLYSGNSYGHQVWRVAVKRSDYLNPINNTGAYVYEISPDLQVTRYTIQREDPEHTPNAGHYFVWLLDYRGVPIDEGPYGGYGFTTACQYARIGARNGEHDRVVSMGQDPEAKSFTFVRRYRRGTGEQIL